jgi:hypothetical protein
MRTLLATLVVTTSCSLVNGLDTCTSAPAPGGVNVRVDGQQTLDAPGAMAVMPNGETVVVYSSTARTPANGDFEVRAVRLNSAGARLDGCFSRDEREQVFYQVALGDPMAQVTHALHLVPAPGAMGAASTGLMLLSRKYGTAPTQLVAAAMLAHGCVLPGAEAFTVSIPSADRIVEIDVPPRAVEIPRGSLGEQRYAVFWIEHRTAPIENHVMARVIQSSANEVTASPTTDDPAGAPIDLGVPASVILGLDAVLVDEELVVTWATVATLSTLNLVSQRFNMQLRPIGLPVVLAGPVGAGSLPPGPKVLTAYDGEHLLVLSIQGQPDGNTRAVAQSFLVDGRSAGPPVVVGAPALAANDSFPGLTAMRGGGFVVVWRQQASTAADAVSLRMAALDTYGRKVFNNVACQETDLKLVSAGVGDIGQSAVTVAADGRVLAAYTSSDGATGLAQSDVSLISMAAEQLFPSGELRPTTSAPGQIGPFPPTTGGAHPSCQASPAGDPDRACTCDGTCEAGAVCLMEELNGRAGGSCYLECDPRVAGSCPSGSHCDPFSDTPTEGSCTTPCTRDSDCGVGRLCYVALNKCYPLCALPSDCRTGVCDVYSGFCGNARSNPSGGGFLAPCLRDTDCKSLYCALPEDPWFPNRCEVDCRVGVSTCPEGGLCVALSGSYGTCVKPCVNGWGCPPGLSCKSLLGVSGQVCLI